MGACASAEPAPSQPAESRKKVISEHSRPSSQAKPKPVQVSEPKKDNVVVPTQDASPQDSKPNVEKKSPKTEHPTTKPAAQPAAQPAAEKVTSPSRDSVTSVVSANEDPPSSILRTRSARNSLTSDTGEKSVRFSGSKPQKQQKYKAVGNVFTRLTRANSYTGTQKAKYEEKHGPLPGRRKRTQKRKQSRSRSKPRTSELRWARPSEDRSAARDLAQKSLKAQQQQQQQQQSSREEVKSNFRLYDSLHHVYMSLSCKFDKDGRDKNSFIQYLHDEWLGMDPETRGSFTVGGDETSVITFWDHTNYLLDSGAPSALSREPDPIMEPADGQTLEPASDTFVKSVAGEYDLLSALNDFMKDFPSNVDHEEFVSFLCNQWYVLDRENFGTVTISRLQRFVWSSHGHGTISDPLPDEKDIPVESRAEADAIIQQTGGKDYFTFEEFADMMLDKFIKRTGITPEYNEEDSYVLVELPDRPTGGDVFTRVNPDGSDDSDSDEDEDEDEEDGEGDEQASTEVSNDPSPMMSNSNSNANSGHNLTALIDDDSSSRNDQGAVGRDDNNAEDVGDADGDGDHEEDLEASVNSVDDEDEDYSLNRRASSEPTLDPVIEEKEPNGVKVERRNSLKDMILAQKEAEIAVARDKRRRKSGNKRRSAKRRSPKKMSAQQRQRLENFDLSRCLQFVLSYLPGGDGSNESIISSDSDEAFDRDTFVKQLEEQWAALDQRKAGFVTQADVCRFVWELSVDESVKAKKASRPGSPLDDPSNLPGWTNDMQDSVDALMQGTGGRQYFTFWDFTNMLLAPYGYGVPPPDSANAEVPSTPGQQILFDIEESVKWLATHVPREHVNVVERIKEEWLALDDTQQGVVSRSHVENFVTDAIGDPELTSLSPEVQEETELLLTCATDKSQLRFWDFANLLLSAADIDMTRFPRDQQPSAP